MSESGSPITLCLTAAIWPNGLLERRRHLSGNPRAPQGRNLSSSGCDHHRLAVKLQAPCDTCVLDGPDELILKGFTTPGLELRPLKLFAACLAVETPSRRSRPKA